MDLDAQLMLCTAQALDADAALTNIIDLSEAKRLSAGRPLSVFINVDVAADHTSGTETYAWQIQTDGDEAFGSATTLGETTILYSALLINTLHEIPIPSTWEFEQYLRVYYNGGSTTPTITITAWVGETGSLPAIRHYPIGASIAG